MTSGGTGTRRRSSCSRATGVLTAKEIGEHEERVKEEVTKATSEGMASPDAPAENALTNVYGLDVPKAIEPAAGVETE